mmetsp:Transcript_37673/g.74495  ORF Transcript_37673/g.74495 Transcript_37673/m.74495 type:complete len:104 (+) Transcript_37673:609-920(+)
MSVGMRADQTHDGALPNCKLAEAEFRKMQRRSIKGLRCFKSNSKGPNRSQSFELLNTHHFKLQPRFLCLIQDCLVGQRQLGVECGSSLELAFCSVVKQAYTQK